MEFLTMIATNDISKVRNSGVTPCYQTCLEGQCICALNQPIPLFLGSENEGFRCEGIATPYELHISARLTHVFFTLNQLSDRDKKTYERLFGATIGSVASVKTDSDTRATGMDAATRMMTGMNRDPREIGRDARRDSGRPRAGGDYDPLGGGGRPKSMSEVLGGLFGIGDDDDDW